MVITSTLEDVVISSRLIHIEAVGDVGIDRSQTTRSSSDAG